MDQFSSFSSFAFRFLFFSFLFISSWRVTERRGSLNGDGETAAALSSYNGAEINNFHGGFLGNEKSTNLGSVDRTYRKRI